MNIKKIILYILFLSAFLVYLYHSNYIFNVLIKTPLQSKPAEFELPGVSEGIYFEIEEARATTQKWKKVLYVRGWMATEPNLNTNELYLVLSGDHTPVIFDVHPENVIPRIIAKPLSLDEKTLFQGFEFNIPMYWLNDGIYNPGILLSQNDTLVYSISTQVEWEKAGDIFQIK